MQAFAGRGRKIIAVSASAQLTSPDSPLNFTREQFNQLLEQSQIAIVDGPQTQALEISPGVFIQAGGTKAIYSYAQMRDTQKIQRGLDIQMTPDPSRYTSLAFELRGVPQFFPPTDGGLAYAVTLDVMTYWSRPK